jgi:hypothetical protein
MTSARPIMTASTSAPWGFQSLADMTIVDTGADTRIEFDATNSVTLVGFGDPAVLQAADFIFA